MGTFDRKAAPAKPHDPSVLADRMRFGLPMPDRSGKGQAQGSLAHKRAMMHKKGGRREGR